MDNKITNESSFRNAGEVSFNKDGNTNNNGMNHSFFKKNLILLVVFAMMVFGGIMKSNGQTIADWTFEASAPTTAGPFIAEIGTGSTIGHHAGASTYSSPSGNGSLHSFSSNTWAVGDYYQFSASTTGLSAITISWMHNGSATGPANFNLQYSTDGVNFTTAYSYSIPAGVTWTTSGTPNAATSFTKDLSSVTALNNQTTVYFRITDANTTSINGSTVASGGTSRVDNVIIGYCVAPTLSNTPTNVTCHNASTGAVALTVTGGSSPLAYTWSNGATTQNLSNVGAGTYTVTVTAFGSCSATSSATLTQPANGLSMGNCSETDASTVGGNDGTASAGTVSNNVGAVHYLWSNGQTIATATNLTAGTYTVSVSDNCTTVTCVETVNQPGLSMGPCSSTNVSCFNGSNGTASAGTVSNNVGTVHYLWSNGQTNSTATGLVAASYTVSVSDNLFTLTCTQTITQPPALMTMGACSHTNVSAYGGSDGTATAGTLTNSSGTVHYLWSDAGSQTTAVATGLVAGNYTVTVTDNCTSVSCSQTITQPVPFTGGNLAVYQVGDGTTALGATATASYIKEFDTAGNPGISVSMPTSGFSRLVNNGNSTTEGHTSLSADGKYIITSGYSATVGTANIASTTASVAPRVIDTVNLAGAVGRADSSTTFFSAGNMRSATKGTGNDYWGAGSVTGISYFGNTTSPATIESHTPNDRVVKVYNATLYYSTGSTVSNSGIGLYKFSGMPTATNSTDIFLASGPGSSPYGFSINPAGTIGYIADDAAGIDKYFISGNSWTLAYQLTTTAAREIAVDYSGANPIIYLVDAATPSHIIKIKDVGASSPGTTIVTAPNNNVAYRGITFTPVPNISVVPSSLSFGNVATGNSSLASSFTVTGTNLLGNIVVTPPSGYQISLSNSFSSSPITLTATNATVPSTTINVIFSPISIGTDNVNISCTSTSSATKNIAVTGTGVAPAPPTQLVISGISPSSPSVNGNFNVTILSVDNNNTPQNVIANTTVSLSVHTGSGSVGGTITGTITAGTNSITITGVNYNTAESGVSLTASRTAGDNLSSGNSNTFTVNAIATHLHFSTVPISGTQNSPLGSIMVQALKPDNTIDVNYASNVTLSLATGSGGISGTVTSACVNGVATFTNVIPSGTGVITLAANSSTFSQVTSGNITLSWLVENILPQYIEGNQPNDSNRISYVCRLTLNGLTPNATYFYYNLVVIPADGYTGPGAGDPFFVTTSGPFIATTTGSLGTPGEFDSLHTDNNGSYSGWFMTEPTGNATRFATGTVVNERVILNDGNGGTTAVKFLTTTSGITVLNLGTGPNVTASGIFGQSNGLNADYDKNFIFLYDNTSGSGRPIAGADIEDDGFNVSTSATSGYAPFYYDYVDGLDGEWGTLIPTNLPNGIRRIEQRSLTDGTIVGCAATNPTGFVGINPITSSPISTVNPVNIPVTQGIELDVPLFNPTPTVTAGGNTTFCAGGSVALNTDAYTSYLWSNGATTENINATTSGTYVNTVTNEYGCSGASNAIVVTANPLPVPTITPNGPTSFCNPGSVILDAGNYTNYSWSAGASTESITVTNPGNYNVTVTNSNGCVGSATTATTVSYIPVPTVSISGYLNTCPGGSTTLTASGSSTYSWSPSTGLNTTTGAVVSCHLPSSSPVTYTINGTNACGSSSTQATVTVSAPTFTDTYTNCLCYGDSSATINMNANNGNAPYTYTVTNMLNNTFTTHAGNGAFTHLVSTRYKMVVTDVTGCTSAMTIIITTQPSQLTFNYTVSNVTCNGNNNGSITLNAGGGTGIKTYTDNGSTYVSNNLFSNLSPATYTVRVKDANGCLSAATNTVSITQPAALTFTTQVVNSSCSSNTGKIIVYASGGSGVFNYSDNGGSTYTTGYTFTNLAPGTYSVLVKDANGCTINHNVVVTCANREEQVTTSPASSFEVYPNPATEKTIVTFSSDNESNYSLKIFDMQGRIIQTINGEASAGDNQIEINIADLSQGIYLLTMDKDGIVNKTKLIVQ